MNYSSVLKFIVCLALPLLNCSVIPLAGGSDNPDFKVAGVITSNGHPAANTEVKLIAANFNPQLDASLFKPMVDTTDTFGKFRFTLLESGTFNIQATQLYERTRLLIPGISVVSDSGPDYAAYLSKPGAIKILLPDDVDKVNGYAYIPGTTIFSAIFPGASYAMLDSVPAGNIPEVHYALKNGSDKILRSNVVVISGETTIIDNSAWGHSQRLKLNTTVTGAQVQGNVLNFPVLIRLTKDNFVFSQANSNGSDIRFTKADDTTALAFEIERFDPVAEHAEVWVKVDTVYGNDSTQFITMRWGNSNAMAASKAQAVFDTSNGFQGVWHLNGPGSAIAQDATYNHYDGTPFGASSAAALSSNIGEGRQFDGSSSYINMLSTASGKLNYLQSGNYAVSAWVNTDTLDGKYQVIASKGDFQYNLEIMDAGKWEFTEFHDTTGWYESYSKAKSRSWTYVTGIRSGNKQFLYVNGVCLDDSVYLNAIKPTLTTRYQVTSNNFMLGKRNDFADYYFKGMIDEVRITSTVPSADWIKLCYMNQRDANALVNFK